MEKLSLKELAVPMIKSIDSFNYLLKSHHRRVAVISYSIGKELGLENHALGELVVAASLHDIGALSVQERDMLIQEDVVNPMPHCLMGYHMLKSFSVFKDIAQIIRYHHVVYEDSLDDKEDDIPFASHIIHLADRVDVLISADEFILSQKNRIIEKIHNKVGTTFHPEVYNAFEKVSKADVFWLEINNMTMEQLFKKIDFPVNFDLTIDNILEFARAISRIIDFRSRFTAMHSYTVGHLASLLGSYFDYPKEDCAKLMVAGYLHDIGKIGIDPGLMEKNGPLTEEEFNLMKLHPYYTGQILRELSASDWFKNVVLWAERHHEKVDGHGYPYALEAKELDTGVKILAYADIITALMENRPYREGIPIDEAFEIIDAKLSKTLSIEMFDVLKAHKDEINDVFLESQAHSFEEYNLAKEA